MKPSVWTVFVLVLLILVVQLVGKGAVPAGVFLAALAALLIGALIPEIVAPVLVVVLIALFFNNDIGANFFNWFGHQASAGGALGGGLSGALGSSFNPQANLPKG